ncbi:hypothetical protein DQ04_07671010 [Trypanosoma grayi]|uniref:hypothetical protein n=1 Tax=Trypanosoma grayi TaxID=71804 RepID=UPI0004F4935E|nr:hypothetical protein DQ04_07671010 [Trypanosoma grayi]KEG08229.1 hypothetical protein DQ04_07671010 [Trypanosoma grayi]
MLCHGSHPEHPMRVFKHPKAGLLCSICKACAHPSMAEWCGCTQEGCNYTLCWKCLEIDEQLFETPQVIIRNPLLSHEDMGVCLRTRPRNNAHVLCPLYPGRLMVAVSSAKGTLDPNETYYRLKNGGWLNAGHVVRVLPSQQLIEELAKSHLRAEDERPNNLMPFKDLLVCIDESFRLMDERSPYGPVMALLAFFPMIQYSSNLHFISPEERVAFVRASLGFIHYVFHYVLDEVEHWIRSMDHRVKSTVLTLYVELLGKSLIVARDVAASQIVALPSELGPLVTKTAKVTVALMPIVEWGTVPQGGASNVTLRVPSVASRQVEYEEEQARLFICCYNMVETAGWLLLHTPSFTYDLSDIRPLRVAVSIVPNSESLERMLCQVATNALDRMPSLRNRIHDLDVLEVAILLAGKATCAESQMAVFKLISAIAHKSPRNISQIASLVIAPLVQLAMRAWNTVVANAAFDCFVELAYNDPRVDSSRLGSQGEALALPVCSAVLYPQGVPYQMMSLYEVEERRMALCEHCRSMHPPEGGVLVSEPQFAYFHCQCSCCLHERVAHPLPPPNVPPTLAIQEMVKGGISRLMLFWLKCSEAAVANTVGRLSLKIEVPKEVTIALYRSLLRQDLVGYADAALAVAAQSHLPVVREMQREHPCAPISQYLSCQPGFLTTASVNEQTPGKASYCEETDGLSPSPNVAVKGGGAYASLPGGVSPPLVDFFTGPQKIYLDDVL